MISRFLFINFDAEESLRVAANVAIGKILDSAPCGSTGFAILEKQDEGFRCSIDVSSQHGPFMASSVRSTPIDAIHAIEEKLRNQIGRWWSHCGYDSDTDFGEIKILQAIS